MPSVLTKNLNEQVRAAINHLRLLPEIWCAVHESQQFDHSTYARQIAVKMSLCCCEQLNSDQARMLISLLDRYGLPDHARFKFIRTEPWALSGEEQQISATHRRYIVRHRRRYIG